MAENIPVRGRRDPGRTPGAMGEKPPAHLSKRAKGLWKEITGEWAVDSSARPLLRAALEQLDVYDSALKQLNSDGLTVQTDTGMLRAHPAAKIGQDALSSFRQIFRQLGFEPVEP